MSVRKNVNDRPIIAIGQDESTFHQFTFAKKHWKGPRGENLLLPKSSGEMFMVSGYQSREFGLGLGNLWTNEIKNCVNQKRN